MSSTELICHFCGGVIARPQENWGQWNSPTCPRCYEELSAMSDHEPQSGMGVYTPYSPNEQAAARQLDMTAELRVEATAKGEKK